MKIVRSIVLEFVLLVTMLLCGTATMKILDILFKLNYENIWVVGFIAWIVLVVITIIVKIKNSNR